MAMTKQEIQTVQAVRDYTRSLLDGKVHGSAQCGHPIGRNIYVESWILPKLDALIDHGILGIPLDEWTRR